MRRLALSVALSALALSCDRPVTAPATPTAPASPSMDVAPPPDMSAKGKGVYLFAGVDNVRFNFSLTQHGSAAPTGTFSIYFTDGDLVYDLAGRVTCLATEPATGRAWIGGVVTRNATTDPALQTPIHQIGRDILVPRAQRG